MPFFMDQLCNANQLVAKGVAVRLDVRTLSVETILAAVEKVLYDERYLNVKTFKYISNTYI